MRIDKTERGFAVLLHEGYPPDGKELRLVQHSSIVGDYEDSWDKPGSSALWIGDNHHLNREEVEELVVYLKRWLKTGSLRE